MAVFTEVSDEEARALMHALRLGELKELRGIQGGIENTNYFATTSEGEYVLTLFERLSFEQLPFYLHLMHHLAHHGIPVPDPQSDRDGEICMAGPSLMLGYVDEGSAGEPCPTSDVVRSGDLGRFDGDG